MNDTTHYNIDEITGRITASQDTDFVIIPREYTSKSKIFLRKEALDRFIEMHDAAEKEGIDLQIISAFRGFEYQKGIWERKWNDGKYAAFQGKDRAQEIMKYSAMPSCSRHHWGTDIDLNSLNNKYFNTGEGEKIYSWLVENAAKYGYFQTYTPLGESRPYGYQEEKWHWSYMPLASKFTHDARALLTYDQISNFLGSEHAQEINVIKKYVFGIPQNLK